MSTIVDGKKIQCTCIVAFVENVALNFPKTVANLFFKSSLIIINLVTSIAIIVNN